MDLLALVAEVWSRGGELRAVNGRIRYRGPELPADDPIRAAIAEHRDALLAIAAEYERLKHVHSGVADAAGVAA